jgi:hypothetical protein
MPINPRSLGIPFMAVASLVVSCGDKQLTKKEAATELANALCRHEDDCMEQKFDECVPIAMEVFKPTLPDKVARGDLDACVAAIKVSACKSGPTPDACKKLLASTEEQIRRQEGANAFAGSKTQVAKLAVDQLAFKDAPQWQVSSGRPCPESLLAIAQFAGKSREDTIDPWGTPYELFCGKENMPPGASGYSFAVMSYGPDQKKGTEDDIKSWEKR